MDAPGVPSILQRLAQGRTIAERKVFSAGDWVEALLAPNPKARCVLNSQSIEGGHYMQTMTCSPRPGKSVRISRTGIYTDAGFVGRAMTDVTTEGTPMKIVLE